MVTSGSRPPGSETSGPIDEVQSKRAERERRARERRAARLARRRGERQFLGVVLICAVLFFAVGFVIARSAWSPKPTAAAQDPGSDNPGAGGPPDPPADPPADPDPADNPSGGNPTPTDYQADRGKPAYNIQDRDPIPFESKAAFAAHMKAWRNEEDEWINARWERYQACLELKDLTQDRVKQAFLATPRHKFCRQKNLSRAYDHAYLDIGYGVTISGPHIVSRMTNAINPQPYHKCLEIGTGSGYQAAVLANLSNHVYSIEIIEGLAQETMDLYKVLVADGYDEYQNVHLKAADGYYGWEEYAPFDRIIVTCGIDHHPPDLLKQLAPNGIMVIPVGTYDSQKVLKITKQVDANGEVQLLEEDLYPGRTKPIQFVPFTADGEDRTRTHYLR